MALTRRILAGNSDEADEARHSGHGQKNRTVTANLQGNTEMESPDY
jgi:hypothetical protein